MNAYGAIFKVSNAAFIPSTFDASESMATPITTPPEYGTNMRAWTFAPSGVAWKRGMISSYASRGVE